MHSSPALKCSSQVKIHSSPAKSVRLQDNNAFVFFLNVGFKPQKKEQKLGKKFLKKFISSRDGPKKKYRNKAVMKNARRLPYICCVFLQM